MSSDQPTDLHEVWAQIIDNTAPAQRVWLNSSRPVTLAENTFVLAVPNEFTENQFASKLRTRVEEQLGHALGHATRLVVTVDQHLAAPAAETEAVVPVRAEPAFSDDAPAADPPSSRVSLSTSRFKRPSGGTVRRAAPRPARR